MALFGGPTTANRFDHELIRLAAGYGEDKLSTVLVTGTLFCDMNTPLASHPISGASVGVSCRHTNRKINKSNWVRGKTDAYGDFVIDLPSHLHAIPNMKNECLVRVLRVPKKSPCHRALTSNHHKASTRIKSSSSGNGIRTYSTHRIHLNHKHSHAFNTRKLGNSM
ncbi:uncharacterized protein [Rutidosis leptorrhynchoides]|uniref:uncharacterized protein n=1 Tax=Rutidosis leptorrhynchoides TaxID=125765 RepID=UPI003A99DF05